MKVKIFIDDLYKNGVEPKVNEQVYKIRHSLQQEYYVKHIIEKHGKYCKYGGRTDENTLFTKKGDWDMLNIHNAYIIREVNIL